MRQFTQAAEVLRLETKSIDLLSPLIFPAKCQLPIVKSLIVGIPCQPPAIHAILPGRQVNFRRPGHRHLIVVLVHIVGFNDFLRAVLRQKGKQWVQRAGVVGPGNRGKGAPGQTMGNICFQQPLDHIDHPGGWVTDQMYRAAGACPVCLRGRGKPDVLGPRFLRRVILVFQRHIQHDLKSLQPAVKTDGGDQDAGGLLIKRHCPMAAVVPVKSGYALHPASLPDQPVRDRAA